MSDDKKRVAREFWIIEGPYGNTVDFIARESWDKHKVTHVREVLPIGEDLDKVIDEAAKEHASHGAETIMGYARFAPISAEDFKCGARFGLSLNQSTQESSEIKKQSFNEFWAYLNSFKVPYNHPSRDEFGRALMVWIHGMSAGAGKPRTESERLAPGIEWVIQWWKDNDDFDSENWKQFRDEALRIGIKLKGDKA